jgi:hypothetical protein
MMTIFATRCNSQEPVHFCHSVLVWFSTILIIHTVYISKQRYTIGLGNEEKLSKVYYSPTNAQVNCLKNNIKIYIKIAPTCFGAVAPSSGSSLSVLVKVTLC